MTNKYYIPKRFVKGLKEKTTYLKQHVCQRNLTILTWKNLRFTEFSTKINRNTRLAVSDVFHKFTQSIKLLRFCYRTDV